MRFSISGRNLLDGNTRRATTAPAAGPPPLTTIRVGAPEHPRALGRRSGALSYDRIFVPSLVIDHTELMLRQHGAAGGEGFGLWAGTLSGGDAFVSTLVVPRVDGGGCFHGEVSPSRTARVFEELDLLDLVPITQIHSHPEAAYLSSIDAQRPLVAVAGFLSLIVPDFGFFDLVDVGRWRAYEYHGRDKWRELDVDERKRRLIIDPSLIRID
jgi:hypothetical protein